MGEPDRGQHYLIDEKIVDFIIKEADLKKDDVVLDIGAGRGALTKRIDKTCPCIAIEIDEENINILRKLPLKNTKIYSGNALQLIPKFRFTKVVSNIPYSISEPLFYILAKKTFEHGIMTIGENFWNVLCSETKAGILFRAAHHIQKIKDVEKNSFSPSPRTPSAIIKIHPKEQNTEEKILYRLLFLDDKKLKNAITAATEGIATKNEVRKTCTATLYEKKLKELSNTEFLTLRKDTKTLLMKKASS